MNKEAAPSTQGSHRFLRHLLHLGHLKLDSDQKQGQVRHWKTRARDAQITLKEALAGNLPSLWAMLTPNCHPASIEKESFQQKGASNHSNVEPFVCQKWDNTRAPRASRDPLLLLCSVFSKNTFFFKGSFAMSLSKCWEPTASLTSMLFHPSPLLLRLISVSDCHRGQAMVKYLLLENLSSGYQSNLTKT